jgi:hypothetical protein
MSPYTLFPSFSFLERVYNDGFRIILYSVKDYKKNYDKFFTHRLFPVLAVVMTSNTFLFLSCKTQLLIL